MRIGLAALLGMSVGYERERQNQPAGLRTCIVIAEMPGETNFKIL